MVLLALAAITTASAAAGPRVLVFSHTKGFRHDSVPVAKEAMQKLADERKFTVSITEDPTVFTDENLRNYDVVMFLLTTGDVLNPEQERAFEAFIRRGRGFVGVHSASDTEYEWPFYARLVGAHFMSHPPGAPEAEVKIEDRRHQTTRMLPPVWRRKDEWYDFKQNPRGKVKVLATVDESTYPGGKMGADHPVIWCHETERGRAWYTAMGHTQDSYREPLFLDKLHQGILWSARRR